MTRLVPAATVIIVRDQPDGYEMLMLERHSQLAFAGGATVFPGGRIDEDDQLIAADATLATRPHGADADDLAARVAAIRESLEEVGVPIGLTPLPSAKWQEWREALHGGALFSRLLRENGMTVDLAALTPFARWSPNFRGQRAFDTRFYLTCVPDGAHEAGLPDGQETTHIFWDTPQHVLEEAAAGKTRIIFPTRRNLERLATCSTYATLKTHAEAYDIIRIEPRVLEIDGEEWLCIPDNLGYPVSRQRMATVERG